MEFKGTKGIFSDGHTGWKIDNRVSNGVHGFEIHYSDDGECVTDHVYTTEDAKLIAAAPDLLEALIRIKDEFELIVDMNGSDNWTENETQTFEQAKKAIEKALL